MMTVSPSVYVGTYAKYNNGSLKGAWVDLTEFDCREDFIEHCLELHNDEQDPELMFQDCEHLPDQYYSECSIDAEAWDYIEACNSVHDQEVVDAGLAIGIPLDKINDAYCGSYDDDEDFAWHLVEETGMLSDVPESIKSYFDYERYARDLMMEHTAHNGHYFHDYY